MSWAQVSFQGNGPLANLQTIADATGLVKGKVGNPQADPPLRPDGKLDVGAAVGRGMDTFKEEPLAGAFDLHRHGVICMQAHVAAELPMAFAKSSTGEAVARPGARRT